VFACLVVHSSPADLHSCHAACCDVDSVHSVSLSLVCHAGMLAQDDAPRHVGSKSNEAPLRQARLMTSNELVHWLSVIQVLLTCVCERVPHGTGHNGVP